MKINEYERGSFTVESAIVTGILLIVLTGAICLTVKCYSQTLSYADSMRREFDGAASSDLGMILRIVKVVIDKGGEIINEIIN